MTSRRDAPSGVIGMVHLLPLPGAPRYALDLNQVIERALTDATALAREGVDAILVENFGDLPFLPDDVGPATVAAMTRVVSEVRSAVECPVGVNVLRNDAAAALAIAAATGAAFVRVNVHTGGMFTDQGWIEGRAAGTLRLRERIAPRVAILADVLVKHAAPPVGVTLPQAARDTWHRGLADALIVTGSGTGAPTDLDQVREVRAAVPDAAVLVGSGITPETVAAALGLAGGVIVGSALETGGVAGNPVAADRVAEMMAAARA